MAAFLEFLLRCHSDRAKEFLAAPAQPWIAKHGLKQTMTGGDDPASNGRVESEINRVKRRLRLTLRASKGAIQEWPNVARHVVEEKQRSQLERVGLRTLPMVEYNREGTRLTPREWLVLPLQQGLRALAQWWLMAGWCRMTRARFSMCGLR